MESEPLSLIDFELCALYLSFYCRVFTVLIAFTYYCSNIPNVDVKNIEITILFIFW